VSWNPDSGPPTWPFPGVFPVPNISPVVHPEGAPYPNEPAPIPGNPHDPRIAVPGTVTPSVPSPPTVAPPSAPPSPVMPPISPTPSPSSPATPSATPGPSSGAPPTLPSEPPVRIWEDHREWSGERRTEPRSRIPIPRTPAPVFEGEWSTRPQPSPVWPTVGGIIGRLGGAIAGIFWPTEMGDGELTPEQQREGRERYEASEEAKADAIRGEELARAVREMEAARAAQWPGRYHRPQVEGTAGGLLEQEVPAPVIPERPVPVPVPEMTPPAPATFPRSETSQRTPPSSSPRSSSTPRPSRTRTPTPQPSLGQELLEALLEGLISGASSWARNRARTIGQEAFSLPTPAPSTPTFPFSPATPFADPLTPPRVPGMDPLTPPRGNPLTSINTGSVGFGPPRVPSTQGEEQDRCRCKPKKRKPARKCHAKAGLRWVGGPKSGQLAGSRCYAFTNGD